MKDTNVIDYKCPSCNAKLTFNPKSQNWICEYCGSTFELKDLDNNTKKYDEKKINENVNYDVYRCPDCGAQIITDENTTATFCVYCKNTSIIKERLSGKFEPKLIIPFFKTIEDAKEAFKIVGKKHPLMPKSFSSEKNIEDIKGVYIPFWLFDVKVNAFAKYKGKQISTWRSGDYLYTKEDVYHLDREGFFSFEKVPNDGAKKFPDDIMNTIEPFDYKKLVPFNPSYLSGFLAEKYDIDAAQVEENVKMRVKNTISILLRMETTSYSGVTILESSLDYQNFTSDFVLLPVYMLNIKYKNKLYTFAYNGESGEMVGNMPIDIKKAILYFIGLTLIIFIVLFIIFFIFFRSNVG